ncbi:MAG: glycosyltransferase family 39 protein [Ardenticatenales bacterium]|nr:glycosyltransferase family 39 protein [Ardenticatenales bacterium]
MALRRPPTVLLALLALMIPLALAWWLFVPPWEAPDGIWHWHFAAHLADGGGLPRSVEEARDAPWRQEGSQPPLYYALVALVVRPFDRGDSATAMRDNPHAAVGVTTAGGNVNRVVHPPGERFPWHGVARAARAAGLVSLALAVVAVLATFAAARRLLPDLPDVALAAAATVALSPATLFFGTQVSNDIAALAAGAIVLWAVARVLDGGATARNAAALGIACGTALLCKLNGLFLIPPAIVAILVAGRAAEGGHKGRPYHGWYRRGESTGAARPTSSSAFASSTLLPLAAFTLTLTLLAVWWPLRNLRLFGDPTGLPLMWAAMQRRPSPPGLAELAGQIVGVWKSMWAVFGWYNLPASDTVFIGLAAAAVIGVAGAMWATWRGDGRMRWAVATCALIVTSLLAGVVLWARVQFPQGRLMFPAVPALAVLLAVGWGVVGRPMFGARRWPWVIVAGWAMLSAWLLATVVAPAYRAPAAVPAAAGGTGGADVLARFDGGITLEAAGVATSSGVVPDDLTPGGTNGPPPLGLKPGDSLVVDLRWSATQPISRDLSVFIHLVDSNGLVVAQHDSYPAAGRWATSDWPVDVAIPDRHVFRLPPATAAPCDCTAIVGLYDHRTGQRVRHGGSADTVLLSFLSVRAPVGPDGIPSPMRVRFGDAIELVGYRLPTRSVHAGETLPLTLYWRSTARLRTDHKVSVQLRRGAAETWGQRDEAPADGTRPTSGWRRGEVVADDQPVPVYADAPPDAYTLFVKVYDPARGGLSVDVFGHELALAPVRVLAP